VLIQASTHARRSTVLLLSAVVTAFSCATTGPTPDQQISGLRDELNASRRSQEDLRSRLERLEARVNAKASAAAILPATPAQPPADPMQGLPVVRLEAPKGRGTGLRAPDLDTSIPLRDPSDHQPVVFEHTVTDTETPIDLNAIVARQASSTPSSKPKFSRNTEGNADDEFQAAVVRYNAGQYPEATESFRQFARQHPKHPAASEALYMGGMAQVAANRCLEAKSLFEAVTREYPGTEVSGRALLAQAKCEANVGHDDAARSLFNRVVSEHPTSAEATQAKSALADLSAGHAP
jgi:TolA-binding protein